MAKRKQRLPVGATAYFPIAPKDGLYLLRDGAVGEERFAKLFAETWREIPASARRVMKRVMEPFKFNGHRIPLIKLSEVMMNTWRANDRACTMSQCGNHGRKLTFWAQMMAALPEEHVKPTIAHELAHVYLIGLDPEHTSRRNAERDVDRVLRGWGFDQAAQKRFLRRNSDRLPWHPGEVEDMPKKLREKALWVGVPGR